MTMLLVESLDMFFTDRCRNNWGPASTGGLVLTWAAGHFYLVQETSETCSPRLETPVTSLCNRFISDYFLLRQCTAIKLLKKTGVLARDLQARGG